MTLDLRQLRYFVAAAEEGHITRAAERLGMAQPPLSQQIKALEERLGLRLFHRKARGVVLTEGGAALLEEARVILARLEQAERAARSAARGERGQLRVGVAPTAPFHPFLPRVVRAFHDAYPGVTVTLDECLSRQAVQGLKEVRLDVPFVRAEIIALVPESMRRMQMDGVAYRELTEANRPSSRSISPPGAAAARPSFGTSSTSSGRQHGSSSGKSRKWSLPE